MSWGSFILEKIFAPLLVKLVPSFSGRSSTARHARKEDFAKFAMSLVDRLKEFLDEISANARKIPVDRVPVNHIEAQHKQLVVSLEQLDRRAENDLQRDFVRQARKILAKCKEGPQLLDGKDYEEMYPGRIEKRRLSSQRYDHPDAPPPDSGSGKWRLGKHQDDIVDAWCKTIEPKFDRLAENARMLQSGYRHK